MNSAFKNDKLGTLEADAGAEPPTFVSLSVLFIFNSEFMPFIQNSSLVSEFTLLYSSLFTPSLLRLI